MSSGCDRLAVARALLASDPPEPAQANDGPVLASLIPDRGPQANRSCLPPTVPATTADAFSLSWRSALTVSTVVCVANFKLLHALSKS